MTLGAAPALRLRLGILPGAVLCAVAGALAVLALPPYSMLLALPVAFSALYALLQGRRPVAAFALGYAFGLGYFGLGVSWIAESFYVDAERFGWLAIPAVASLAAGLAIFPGLAAAAFAAFRVRDLLGAATFAACWMAAEWLRGHVLTGFPWNLAGYALADWDALRQLAVWTGSYGLSFLAVLAATVPAVMFGDRTRIGRLVPATAFAVLVVGAWVAGQARLAAPAPAPPGAALRIVQGNVPQEDKWDAARRTDFVRRYLELSGRSGSFDVLLWPETAFPGYLDESREALASIAVRLPEGGVLLTGSPDREQVGGRTLYHNSIFAIDAGGRILAEYAKHHLVPFGEYVPFRGWLPVERVTEGLGDFASGPGPRTLAIGAAPLVGATICYEAIFPGHVVDDAIRPDWIFNATNDAWFGTSIGPWQHLASARMRAVEEGLPMVRAANTGVSAVIDARGRTQAQLGLGETGILDAPLPPALPRTLYAWAGDVTLPPLVLAALALAAVLDRATRRTRRENRREQ